MGLAFAIWGTHRIAVLMANGDPAVAFDVAPDGRILLFTIAISLGSALLAGVIPALRVSRSMATPFLRDDSRTVTAGRTVTLWNRTLIAGQVALSLLLLAGALLLVTTLRNLRTFDFGFDREHVLTMRVDPGERLIAYFREVLERARSTSGVRAAALSLGMPVIGAGINTSFGVEGQPRDADAQVYVNEVSDGYFATTETRLLLGRDFEAQDRPGSTPVAIINDTIARRFFEARNPIGQRINVGRRGVREVVGVVATSKYQSLREIDSPIVYVPALQSGDRTGLTLLVLGVTMGVAAGLALTRVLSSVLYGVTATDPWVLSGAVACLFVVALAASAVPAWRAMRVDPLVALRYE